MWHIVRNTLLMCGIAWFGGIASASVVVPASLADLVAEADAVVYARVTDVEFSQAHGSLRVEQTVTLAVLRSAKGSWPAVVRIAVPGGTLGRYRTVVPGAPQFVPGDEALFFLRAQGTGRPRIIGLSQGLVRVAVDAASGARMVRPPPDAETEGPLVRGDTVRRPVSLATFEARVAALLSSQARLEARR